MRILLSSALALIVAAPAVAASPFDGNWKADIKSAKLPAKPQMLSLKDGVFTCSSCTPVFTVKADGVFHPITGHPYTDEAKVEVVDPHTIVETDKLKGKIVYVTKQAVSADGKTMMASWVDTSSPDGKTLTGSSSATRVTAAGTGGHAISGAWRRDKMENISDAAITQAFKVDGDWLSLTTPNGYSYKAKFGGPKVPLVGDTADTMVMVRKLNPMTIFEEDSRKGEVINTYTYTALPGGRTMKMVVHNTRQNTDTIVMMNKI